MRTVNNYDELLEYTFDYLDRSKEADLLELKGEFNYTIRVSGRNWDQYIDWRLAKLITEFQNSINKALKEANIDLTKEEEQKTTVKFRISEGSSLIEINCGDLFQVLADHMTGGELTAIAIAAILVTGGVLTVRRIMARREKAEDEKTKRELAKVIESVAQYEKPMRGLLSRMDREDTVEISPTDRKFNRSELRTEYPGKSKYRAENVYIDGIYTVVAIKLDAGTIAVEKEGHRFDCQSSLGQEESEELFSKVQEAHAKGKGFDLPLKITAEYYPGSKQLKKQTIYEIGEPRKGTKYLADLLD